MINIQMTAKELKEVAAAMQDSVYYSVSEFGKKLLTGIKEDSYKDDDIILLQDNNKIVSVESCSKNDIKSLLRTWNLPDDERSISILTKKGLIDSLTKAYENTGRIPEELYDYIDETLDNRANYEEVMKAWGFPDDADCAETMEEAGLLEAITNIFDKEAGSQEYIDGIFKIKEALEKFYMLQGPVSCLKYPQDAFIKLENSINSLCDKYTFKTETLKKDITTMDIPIAIGVSQDLTMGAGLARYFYENDGDVKKLTDQTRNCLGSISFTPGYVKVLSQKPYETVYLILLKMNRKDKADVKDLEPALESLKHDLQFCGKTSVALPRIGCGHEGFTWPDVYEVIKKVFTGSGIEVYICEK